MLKVTDFKKLKVWQKSHMMVLGIDRLIGEIRGAKYSALRSQLLRSAMSVPANIVEGSGQKSAREFARFVRIALNSSTELEYHLILARDLQAVRAEPCLTSISEVIEVRKMLYGLLRYLHGRSGENNTAP
ncbi:MAG: four helix bundle protein [Gemmatimonadales bacterium]